LHNITSIGSAGLRDGNGSSALFNFPYGMAVDDQSLYLYVADSSNNRVRRININSPGFAVSTLPTTITSPFGLVIDDSNTNLYVSSSASNSVYKLTLNGYVLSLYAGSGSGNNISRCNKLIVVLFRLTLWIY